MFVSISRETSVAYIRPTMHYFLLQNLTSTTNTFLRAYSKGRESELRHTQWLRRCGLRHSLPTRYDTTKIMHSKTDRKLSVSSFLTFYSTALNPWPTFSSYIYYRVQSELTSSNPLSHSRLACSRLCGHIQSSQTWTTQIRMALQTY